MSKLKSLSYSIFVLMCSLPAAGTTMVPKPPVDAPVIVDCANAGWTWTGMSPYNDTQCLNGAGRAGGPGSTADYAFDGSGVSICVLRAESIVVDGKAHKVGRIAVKLDSTFNSEIAISYPEAQYGYVAFSAQDLTPGHHTLHIAPVAGWAVIDHLTITPARIDPAHPGQPNRQPDTPSDLGPVSTIDLVPYAYRTLNGKDNAQPVAATIDHLDEDGNTNDWFKYLQFQARTAGAPYFGTRAYHAPVTVDPAAVAKLDIKVNYLGPLSDLQKWTWYLYDWSTQTWTPIGSNAGAPGWSHWSTLSFTVDQGAGRFVQAGTGEIAMATASNNAADDADIDYEKVTVTYHKP